MEAITDNVNEFIQKTAKAFSQFEEQRFINSINICCKNKCKSPIETMFYTAISFLLQTNPISDVKIISQYKIGKYIVDFLVIYKDKKIVVELDGHDFHDRDKNQRSYEKSRDRFLQSKGYIVLHFTGSDVFKNPFICAYECLSFLIDGIDRYFIFSSVDECQILKQYHNQ